MCPPNNSLAHHQLEYVYRFCSTDTYRVYAAIDYSRDGQPTGTVEIPSFVVPPSNFFFKELGCASRIVGGQTEKGVLRICTALGGNSSCVPVASVRRTATVRPLPTAACPTVIVDQHADGLTKLHRLLKDTGAYPISETQLSGLFPQPTGPKCARGNLVLQGGEFRNDGADACLIEGADAIHGHNVTAKLTIPHHVSGIRQSTPTTTSFNFNVGAQPNMEVAGDPELSTQLSGFITSFEMGSNRATLFVRNAGGSNSCLSLSWRGP